MSSTYLLAGLDSSYYANYINNRPLISVCFYMKATLFIIIMNTAINIMQAKKRKKVGEKMNMYLCYYQSSLSSFAIFLSDN